MRNTGKTRLNSRICDQNSKTMQFSVEIYRELRIEKVGYLVSFERLEEGVQDWLTISSVKL